MSLPADPRPVTEPARAADDSGAGMMPKLLPELCTFLLLLGLWLGLLPGWLQVPPEETVIWLAAIEGATLLFMTTLVDIATRLRRPPPWWAGLLIAMGLLAVFPDVIGMLLAAWQLGLWVFLPFLWSVQERLRELWTLPKASQIEKLRRRALSFGRLSTGLVLAGVYVATLLGHSIVLGDAFDVEQLAARIDLPMLALFFLIASFDAWRVHRPAFAVRPRALWPFFDGDETARIDPL